MKKTFNINLEKIKKTASKSALITFAAVIVAGVIGTWSVNILIKQIIHDRSEVLVPDIEGMPLEEALELLSERNLSLSLIARKYDPDIPSGSVISQTPPPGLMVREGGVIETVISSGGQVVFVPRVEGRVLREAEMLIRQAGLQMGEQTRTYSRTVEEGYVVSQSPPPDEVVQGDSYVDIVVSLGSADYDKVAYMPDLEGMRIRNAERVLNEMGLRIAAVKAEIYEELPEGTVVKQSPEAGVEIETGKSVDLIISRKKQETLQVREEIIRYNITSEDIGSDIKIILSDDIRDEYVLYEETAEDVEKIEIPVRVLGKAKVQVFSGKNIISEKIYEEKKETEEYEELLDTEDPGEDLFFEDIFPEDYGEIEEFFIE